MKPKLICCLLLLMNINVFCQKNHLPKNDIAKELKSLIELNNKMPDYVNLSGPEFNNICDQANVAQLVNITKQYLNTDIINAKSVCYALLANALLKKANSLKDTQALVEVFCKYYTTEKNIYHLNTFTFLKEKDFNNNSKKYIAKLNDSLNRIFEHVTYQLLAMAQIKASSSNLWKRIDSKSTIGNFRKGDLIILSSLSRLGDSKATDLLLNHYNTIKDMVKCEQVLIAEILSFSLNQQILNCLIADYKITDRTKIFRDGDTGYHPAIYLAFAIASMIKNYPHKIDRDPVSEDLFFKYLKDNSKPEVAEK